jgi:hypothetical protein
MAFGNDLLTMICWHGNTFMSHGTIDEDAKIPEIERGAPVVVAWHRRGRSGGYPVPRVRHLSTTGLSISQRCACERSCGTSCRTVGAGNLQNSQRCIAAITRLFCRQRADVERNSHARRQELSDIGHTTAPEAWLGGSGIFVCQSRWSLLLIAWCTSRYSKPMKFWFRIAFAP